MHNKPAASNAGGFRKQAFSKPKNDRGKENNKQVNPALAAAGGALAATQIIRYMEKLKVFLKNGWVIGFGTTFASVIVLNILNELFNITFLRVIFSALSGLLSSIISIFSIKISIPIWSLILLSLTGLSLYLIIPLIISVIRSANSKKLPPFINYTSDEFHGVFYRWNYKRNILGGINIQNITPYCRQHNTVLFFGKCVVCNRYYSTELPFAIEQLIRYKIENNLYSS